MNTHQSDFLNRVVERGFLHQCTDTKGLDAIAACNVVTAYIGFDCTAPSLHAGSLVSIMLLRLLQQSGHKPIVLLGGGTTKVGDPSGKDQSRKLLDDKSIAANMAGIQKVFTKYLSFGEGLTDAIIVNNADWLDQLEYITFLRDYGRQFSVNRMLSFDSVKLRLDREQPLSFLEFNYMILQAFDFVELNKRHNCILQMGGSDQWGNIINGVDLGRRVVGNSMFGLTTPLITTTSGVKMGKTAEGAVWLDSDMLSPYDYWQYWRNTEDIDVGRFLRFFTELPMNEILELETLKGVEINEAKKILADQATRLCHGKASASLARETAEVTFEKGELDNRLPIFDITAEEFNQGIPAFELIVRSGLAKTNGEARRLIRGGGARISDQIISEETLIIRNSDLNTSGMFKLSVGKKRHILIRSQD